MPFFNVLYFFQKFVFTESQIETKCGRDLCFENGDGIFFKTGVTRFPCSGARPDQSQGSWKLKREASEETSRDEERN